MKLLLVILCLPVIAHATELGLEIGSVRNPYNRIAVPGDDGTEFSLAESFSEKIYHRVTLVQMLSKNQGLRFLYAPLRLTGSKRYSKDIDFQGVNFPADIKTQTEYQFNSYRGTYFYQWEYSPKFFLRAGGTLKIRDAKIKLSQGSRSKFTKNSGLVPLLYVYTEYKLAEKVRLAFDFDGWVAPQGRALDGALMAGYYFRDNLHWNLGYRVLEGGADNDKVFTFARLEYIFTSVSLSF